MICHANGLFVLVDQPFFVLIASLNRRTGELLFPAITAILSSYCYLRNYRFAIHASCFVMLSKMLVLGRDDKVGQAITSVIIFTFAVEVTT